MAFNSIAYLAFLAAVTLLFFLVPRQWRRGLLLVASIAFYAAWKPVFVLAPVALAVWIRFMARRMAAPPRQSTRVFWVACGAIVAALVVFKTRSLLAAVAPVGISFYSFEAISYLIDVRQKRLAEPSFVDLLLYLLFWPTIVSGPILRARELLPQLKFDEPLDARLFVSGVDRIVWGLVQKNAIANVLGSWVDAGFAASRSGYSTLDGWTLACAYGLQIYFDFAAYSNMAIGSAQLIGIRLPENFRFPYHASTPPEFWSRWHMSLSRWIRDYLFFRLNAKYRGAAGRLYVSLIAVMALVGLWHGAGWGFLLWGGLHGAYLALYRLYENTVQRRRPELLQARVLKSGWRLATLAGVALAWVPFRAGGSALPVHAVEARLLEIAPRRVLHRRRRRRGILCCRAVPHGLAGAGGRGGGGEGPDPRGRTAGASAGGIRGRHVSLPRLRRTARAIHLLSVLNGKP
jgi:alginate O-acetyltransferase complex protein AlgI